MTGPADALVRLRHPDRGGAADARWRLVGCPPSGSGAQYFRALAASSTGPALELWSARYPGRESRLGEPCATSLPCIADEICAALTPLLAADDLPTVLLGHSMGVGVAAEVAVEMERRLPGRLSLLALSARAWTGVDESGRRAQRGRDAELSRVVASDGALKAWLADLGGTPQILLDDEPFMAMQLPILRADLLASLAHEPPAPQSLTTPLMLLCGDRDRAVTAVEMQGWETLTTGPVAHVQLRGGHDAVVTDADALLDTVAGMLFAGL